MKEIIEIAPEIQQLVNSEMAWHYKVLPKSKNGNVLELYIDESENLNETETELSALFGMKIHLLKSESQLIKRSLGRYYRTATSGEENFKASGKKDFLDTLISEANQLGSSDIHIEAYADKGRIRIRIDGHLIHRYSVELVDYPELVNKIKIKANLDISEKRLPQDGRIEFENFDIRVSILPTLYGEKIVLRILGQDASALSIEKVGFSGKEKHDYLESIKKPSGIVLISGPTGSGKTTTLYSTLKLLNEEKRNILTVEDPVEYTLDGINQVQLKESIGLTFAAALRSFLRQDPDVIMLGEIRDGETAQMAIRAALTGHLVLSTIHTNSAWGTISRLIDMGVPAFLIANTINASVAQRLVRKLCEECKAVEEVDRSQFFSLSSSFEVPSQHYVARGCHSCHYSGYKGRTALYEVIIIDNELAQAIKKNESEVDQLLTARGIKRLPVRAFDLYLNGITSMEEIYPLLIEAE